MHEPNKMFTQNSKTEAPKKWFFSFIIKSIPCCSEDGFQSQIPKIKAVYYFTHCIRSNNNKKSNILNVVFLNRYFHKQQLNIEIGLKQRV